MAGANNTTAYLHHELAVEGQYSSGLVSQQVSELKATVLPPPRRAQPSNKALTVSITFQRLGSAHIIEDNYIFGPINVVELGEK